MVLVDVGEYLGALVRTFSAAISADPGAVGVVGRFGWAVPAGIALIGGIAFMLGQSAVLAINKVTRLRGGLTLLAAGLGMILMAAIEASVAGLAGWLLIGDVPGVEVIMPSVLISYAPYWFGFLVLLPYTGPVVARVLHVWHFILLWTMLTPLLGVGPTQALVVAAAAWFATLGLDWLVEHSPLRLRERAFRWVSGSHGLTSRELMRRARLGVGE